MKKFFALVLAIMMVMSLATTAFADDATGYTITIANPAPLHTYDAYQIFDGDLHDGILANVVFGPAVKSNTDTNGVTTYPLLDALKADTVAFTMIIEKEDAQGNKTTETITTNLQEQLANVTNAASLAEVLAKLSDDSYALDRFAEVVGTYVDANTGHAYLNGPTATVSNTDANNHDGYYKFTNLDAGYYLIKDRDGSVDGHDFYTKYILRVTKNQTVKVKGTVPTVDKKIATSPSADYQEWKDFDINDTAHYRLIGTLPDNYENYFRYYYKFEDTLPAGITFSKIEKIYVRNNTNHSSVPITFYDMNNKVDGGYIWGPGNIKADGVHFEATDSEGNVVATIKQSTNGQVVTVEFSNLKKLAPALTDGFEIVVEYEAKITAPVAISEYGKINPNTNVVTLEYTNNPSGEGTGETVSDPAHALTFTIKLNKHVKNAIDTKLADAHFVIYYELLSTDSTTGVETRTPMYAQADKDGKLTGYTADKNAATVFVTDAEGNASLSGVDSGTYLLEEIKAPAGYNLLDAPIKYVITPDIKLDSAESIDKTNSKLVITVDGHEATDGTAFVENSGGAVLPETGGMGTTLFYVIGSVLVMGALVMLITKKRMAAEN